MYKKFLCSFADKSMNAPKQRFIKQAHKMEFYDNICVFDETTLNKTFIDIFHSKFNQRGFGYWSWKPQIILQTFEKMDYGDILQYSDIGCHLNFEGRNNLFKYFNTTYKNHSNFLVFEMEGKIEKIWTKGDCFDFFNFRNNNDIINSPQIWAGSFIVKKTKFSEKIILEWLNIIKKDFNLINDSDSISSNFSGFIEHRHDQSLFSLIAKKYNFMKLQHGKENTKYFAKYPILALRDKTDGKKWIEILDSPRIIRVFKVETKFKRKIIILLEVILGQKISNFLKKIIWNIQY